MDKRKEFGIWIKGKRNQTGLSLWEVSQRLGYRSRGTLACVECGQMSLPLERIFDLADLYQIDLNEIVEKLRECEPALYEKFTALEKRFMAYFLKGFRAMETTQAGKLAGLHKQNYQDVENHHEKAIRKYRPEFPNVIMGLDGVQPPGLKNTLYIIGHWNAILTDIITRPTTQDTPLTRLPLDQSLTILSNSLPQSGNDQVIFAHLGHLYKNKNQREWSVH